MSNQNQIHRTTGMGMNRRRFMQAVAGTAAAGSMLALEDGPVGQSQAIAPVAAGVLAGAGIAAGGVALGWALREFEVIGADDPPQGLTADALRQKVYEIVLARRSNNKSTFVDNSNIIDGIHNNAYIDGKLAAFEALNAEKSQSEVETAATAAVDKYATTVKKNYLKSWNESVREAINQIVALEDHSDTNAEDFIQIYFDGSNAGSPTWNNPNGDYPTTTGSSTSVTLDDGTSFEVLRFDLGSSARWSPVGSAQDDENNKLRINNWDGQDTVQWLVEDDWRAIYDDMVTQFDNVRDGLLLWVDSIYGQVQSGDVEVSDLITPKERAAMMTDDGKYPQAVADLVALNVPVDLEREATISLDYLEEDVTLRGTLGITSPPDTLESGTQYDPAADSLGSVYLTYDVGTGEGYWTGYDDAKGVDGGTVEFEKEPLPEVTYRIETNYNETAEVPSGDFTEGTDGSSNTVWTVDVSDQLENSIAEISEVTFYTPTEETRYETIQIEGAFTIEKFMNQETGEEETQANFESSEPQSDSNYVTQEQWDELQAQNEELIQKYEDATSGGGGGGFLPDIGSLSPVQKAVGAVGIGGGGYALLNGGIGGGGSGGGGSGGGGSN